MTGLPALSSTRTRIPRPTASPQSGTGRADGHAAHATVEGQVVAHRQRAGDLACRRRRAEGDRLEQARALREAVGRDRGPGPENAGPPLKRTRSAISSAWPVFVKVSVWRQPEKIPQLGS